MKIERKKLFKISTFVFVFLIVLTSSFWLLGIHKSQKTSLFSKGGDDVLYAPSKSTVILEYLQKEAENHQVFDHLTMEELTLKLDRNLHSTLSGTGHIFAKKSIELGLDPYLSVAIVLHETGCKWNCSKLVQQCNNVGGMKGKPSCNGGSYRSFPTLEEGIYAYLNNLYYNYVAKGLTTPEQINKRYASSKAWASKIHMYMNQIKESS